MRLWRSVYLLCVVLLLVGAHLHVRIQRFVRLSTSVPIWRFWGDVRREFMQCLSAALHGTPGSYLRDAFQDGSADVVACLHVPRA